MMNRVLLLLAMGLVCTFATPSYATFWNSHNRSRNFQWSGQNDNQNCDWDRDWNRDRDCDDRDWDRDRDCDWDRDRDCDDNRWDCDDKDWNDCKPRKRRTKCDNPVPEPATAGLSIMGLGALAAAVRRRRK